MDEGENNKMFGVLTVFFTLPDIYKHIFKLTFISCFLLCGGHFYVFEVTNNADLHIHVHKLSFNKVIIIKIIISNNLM